MQCRVTFRIGPLVYAALIPSHLAAHRAGPSPTSILPSKVDRQRACCSGWEALRMSGHPCTDASCCPGTYGSDDGPLLVGRSADSAL